MSQIKITHTHADGTLIEGSRKGDGVWETLKGLHDNWRYFRSLGQIGLGQPRDKAAMTHRINRAAEALRTAGHEVSTEIDETQRRSVEEIEADRAQRAEQRAEGLAEAAERRNAQATADYDRAHQMADAIPLGQPILVGHYSEGRDRRYRDRIHNTFGRAFEGMDEAKELGRRAESAEATQAHRESVPTTLRRIEKLEADERDLLRRVEGGTRGRHPYTYEAAPATGERLERLNAALAGIREQLTYWRDHVAKRQAEGVKVWSREDFTKGDYVQFLGTWYEVVRVSAKSVTIPAMINDGHIVHKDGNRCTWTDTVPYHKVRGRKSAAEIAEIIAEVERREAAKAAGTCDGCLPAEHDTCPGSHGCPCCTDSIQQSA